jgi:hypothetical protein
MAKIGTFKKQNDGRLTGTINTLTIRATVELAPTERQDSNDPDFRAWGYARFLARSAARGICRGLSPAPGGHGAGLPNRGLHHAGDRRVLRRTPLHRQSGGALPRA